MEGTEADAKTVEESTAAVSATNETTSPAGETVKLSKNQQKKMRRLERIMQFKAEKRKKEREQRKLKGKNNLAVVENAQGERVQVTRKSLKKNLMQNSSNKLRIVIDCSFESLMNMSDISHLGKQLAYCYASNRRMSQPLQFYMTSCGGKTQELLEKSGLSNWDVHLHAKSYLELFSEMPTENICYLTSDSPNELANFDEDKVYIIGGLVDHNHHKSLCYDLAVKNNLSHAHLPINKYLVMKTRPVLTVNQVFQIICKYVECKDWKAAFMSTLPKRKGAETLDDDDEPSSEKKLKPNNEHPTTSNDKSDSNVSETKNEQPANE